MKVGGNGPAFDYFSRHGGSSLLTPGTEGKVKFTSATARGYKEELTKRVQEDAKGGPIGARVAFPGLNFGGGSIEGNGSSDASIAHSASTNANADDFFDDWDKPAGNSASANLAAASVKKQATAAASGPPGIGRRPIVANNSSSTAPSSGTSTPDRGSSPSITSSSTIKSSSLGGGARGPSGARKGALGATKVGAGTGAVKKGLGGVRKGGAPINFEEAEARAKAEEAEAKRLEDEALKQKESIEQAETFAKAAIQKAQADQAAARAAESSSSSGGGGGGKAGAPTSPTSPRSPTGPKGRGSIETERLGMGFGKLNIAQQRIQAQQATSKSNGGASGSTDSLNGSGEEPSYARSKFAGQKSISSDQYFERGGYDPNVSSEAKERLQGFSGQTSISSNQYFGREEDDDAEGGGYSAAAGGPGGEDWTGDLESAARDYYQRLMANPDVQSGIESFRAGALKLSQYLEDMSRNGA